MNDNVAVVHVVYYYHQLDQDHYDEACLIDGLDVDNDAGFDWGVDDDSSDTVTDWDMADDVVYSMNVYLTMAADVRHYDDYYYCY